MAGNTSSSRAFPVPQPNPSPHIFTKPAFSLVFGTFFQCRQESRKARLWPPGDTEGGDGSTGCNACEPFVQD